MLDLTLEPTTEPTLEPILNTNIPTFRPTYRPSIINAEKINKILTFDVDMKFKNCSKPELDNNGKEILLYSFEELTGINKDYLSIKTNFFRNRFLMFLNNKFYELFVTIIVSIPLIDKYKSYETNPTYLYNSFDNLITNSVASGNLQNIVKKYNTIYNSSIFNDIQMDLIGIGNATIINVSQPSNKNNNLSILELSLTIIFSIIGTFMCFLMIYKYLTLKRTKQVHTKDNNIEKKMLNNILIDEIIYERAIKHTEMRLVETAENEQMV